MQAVHQQVADSLEACGRRDPEVGLQRAVSGWSRPEGQGRQVLLGVHPVSRVRGHRRRRLSAVPERYVPDVLGGTQRVRAASGRVHVHRQRLGDRTCCLLGHRHPTRSSGRQVPVIGALIVCTRI